MTREERIRYLKGLLKCELCEEESTKICKSCDNRRIGSSAKCYDVLADAIKALEQELCNDCISRKSIKQKLQEHHDFFVNAYGGFSNLPQNDKSRVDEITNCIAMVVNEPPVTSQEPRWIPVSERLPEDHKDVLAYLSSNRMTLCRYNSHKLPFSNNPIGWGYLPNNGFIDFEKENVIAWMPLPEECKAESVEK